MEGMLAGSPARAHVIAAFPRAIYLQSEGGVVALVTPEAVKLPNAVVCRELPLRPGTAIIGDGGIRVDGTDVRVSRWWDPVPHLPRVSVAALADTLAVLRQDLPAWPQADHEVANRLVVGRDALAQALRDQDGLLSSAESLVGLGPGLTPAGDDVLAGAMAGLVLFERALGRSQKQPVALLAAAVESLASKTTVLAADLARHAADGAVAEPVGALCAALCGQGSLEKAIERLLTIGHTSGRDLAEGLVLGAETVLAATG